MDHSADLFGTVPPPKPDPAPDPEREVLVFAGTSCLGPGRGPGAWAVLILWRQHERLLTGTMADTTASRLEVLADAAALDALKRSCQVCIVRNLPPTSATAMQAWADRQPPDHAHPGSPQDCLHRFALACRRHTVRCGAAAAWRGDHQQRARRAARVAAERAWRPSSSPTAKVA